MTYPPQWNPPPGDPFGNYPQPQQPNQYPGGYQQPNQYPGGYQQPTNWSGYGEAPPIDSPPPKRDNTPWIIVTVAAVLVVAVVVGGLLWKLNAGADDDTTDTAATTTSAVATDEPTTIAPSTPPSAATAPNARPACEGKIASPRAQTPAGWLPVVSPRGLGYDVPGGWTVNSCTTLVGWEKPCPDGPFGFCPVRTMSGSASMPNAQCPEGSRALTGVPGAKGTEDINAAVAQEAQLVADIYTSKNGVVPQVSLSQPRQLTAAGLPAVQIVATVTGIEGDECTGTSALHSMVATNVPGQPGSVLFVIALEQGYPGAPDPGLIDQLVGTLSPVS
ncbi:MAG TPA: hypothetical protein VL179_08015 [Mycobacterium sp.]|nr:hypothetical protein [Mycobacterium sp.]